MTQTVPTANVIKHKNYAISLSWCIPAITIAVSLVLYVRWELSKGPIVIIKFENASGLTVESPIVFRGAVVGRVGNIELSEDMSHVIVEARLEPSANGLAVEGTTWWIVKPTVSLEGISGLDTIVGPRYIELFIGSGKPTFSFTGSKHAVHADVKRFTLITNSANNISIGSPLYYRGVEAGLITDITLSADAKTVRLKVFVHRNYAPIVRTNTKFWNESGISIDAGFTGLSIHSGPLTSWIKGGISMATPNRFGDIAPEGYAFTIADEFEEEWLEWSPTIALTIQSEDE